jgi:hypothetical protein
MLTILINRANEEGHTSEVIPNLVDDGLSILQYAYDRILFQDHNFEQAKYMKLLLSTFEQLSVLKINFHEAKYSVLGRLKITNHNRNNYLDVKMDHTF